MILNEMAQILQEANLGTIGVNIFTHHMPQTVSTGILLLDRAPGDFIDHELRGIRRGGFQIIVRVSDYNDTLINAILPLLSIESKIVKGLDVKYIRPKSNPFVYPSTDGKNIEYSLNFDAVYAKT